MTTATYQIIQIVVLALSALLSSSLPREAYTDHAYNGRAVTKTIAENMVDELKSDGDGPCNKVEYHFCWGSPAGHRPHIKWLCWINGKVDGLIIGLNGEVIKIVTGYPSAAKYWLRTCIRDRCFPLDERILKATLYARFPGLLK